MLLGATGQREAVYGQGTGPILLDQVRCNGNEQSLLDCPQNPVGQHDCSHDQDASITCSAGSCCDYSIAVIIKDAICGTLIPLVIIILYYLTCMVEYHELSRPSIARVP